MRPARPQIGPCGIGNKDADRQQSRVGTGLPADESHFSRERAVRMIALRSSLHSGHMGILLCLDLLSVTRRQPEGHKHFRGIDKLGGNRSDREKLP